MYSSQISEIYTGISSLITPGSFGYFSQDLRNVCWVSISNSFRDSSIDFFDILWISFSFFRNPTKFLLGFIPEFIHWFFLSFLKDFFLRFYKRYLQDWFRTGFPLEFLYGYLPTFHQWFLHWFLLETLWGFLSELIHGLLSRLVRDSWVCFRASFRDCLMRFLPWFIHWFLLEILHWFFSRFPLEIFSKTHSEILSPRDSWEISPGFFFVFFQVFLPSLFKDSVRNFSRDSFTDASLP